MAVAQKSTASLQKILRNSNFSRMMSSGQGSGRSEGKFTCIFTREKLLSLPIFFSKEPFVMLGVVLAKKKRQRRTNISVDRNENN